MCDTTRQLHPFRRTTSRRAGVPTGCLIAAGIFLLLLIGVGIWVAVSWKGWAAAATKAIATQAINDSQLPQEQKVRLIGRIDSLATDFESGKVSLEQVGKIFEEIAEGPLLPLGIVYAAEEKYIKPAAIPQEEKDAGVRTLQRLARGVFEKKIPKEKIEDVIVPISMPDADGDRQLKDSVTPEELRNFLARAKAEADAAAIPDEPFTVDVAAEVEKAIDKALGKPTP
jgi:hypothetical protein